MSDPVAYRFRPPTEKQWRYDSMTDKSVEVLREKGWEVEPLYTEEDDE